MNKILKGILQYRLKFKDQMLQQFQQVIKQTFWFHEKNINYLIHIFQSKANPNFLAVFLTCADARLLPGRFTQTNPGDMFYCKFLSSFFFLKKFREIEYDLVSRINLVLFHCKSTKFFSNIF